MNATTNTLHTQMYTHYSNWESSGLSQMGYCKSAGLSFAKFNYWVRKLRRGGEGASAKTLGFLSVEVNPSGMPVLEISHKNGHRISFYQPMEASFIKELLG
jgi:hypothetical protein